MTGRDGALPPGAGREVWCRLETAGPLATLRRVTIMQANGEILGSWPPGRLEAGLVERIRSGHIRAFVAIEDGVTTVSLRDLEGREVFSAQL